MGVDACVLNGSKIFRCSTSPLATGVAGKDYAAAHVLMCSTGSASLFCGLANEKRVSFPVDSQVVNPISSAYIISCPPQYVLYLMVALL